MDQPEDQPTTTPQSIDYKTENDQLFVPIASGPISMSGW